MSVPFQSNFYNPGDYAGFDVNNQNWYNTPYGTNIRELDLQNAWYGYLRHEGVPDDDSAFARWVSQQYPNFRLGYGAATMETPDLNIDQYTATLGNYDDWMRRFQNVAPQLRGENPSNFGNVTRWLSW